MRRSRSAVLAAAAAALLVVGTLEAAPKPRGTIKGNVGPGFTISVSKRTVKQGRWRLSVNDRASIHNFKITGQGVSRQTSIARTGRTVWTLNLKPGTYTIVCVPHARTMRTTITVTP